MDPEAKILIIEDEQHTLAMLRQYLEFKGFDTEGAQTGMVGMQKVTEYKPDLLLLDLMLPDMDGFVILKLLRGREEAKDLPVIILSALSSPSSVRQGYEAGATRYLKKPVDLKKLMAEIRAVLAEGRHVEPSDEVVEADAVADPDADYYAGDADIVISPKKTKSDGKTVPLADDDEA